MAQAFTKSLSMDGNLLRPHMQEWERICFTFPYLLRVMFQPHLLISFQAQASWTQRILGQLIQDQS